MITYFSSNQYKVSLFDTKNFNFLKKHIIYNFASILTPKRKVDHSLIIIKKLQIFFPNCMELTMKSSPLNVFHVKM